MNDEKEKMKKPIYKKWWFWLLVVLALLLIVGMLNPSEEKDTGSSSSAAPSSSAADSASDTDSASEPVQEESSSQEEDSEEADYNVPYTKAIAYTNSIGTVWVQVIVEIENTGSSDLYLSSGSYDLEDASGGLIASRTAVSTFPDVIKPGEKAYMYEETTLDSAVDGEITVVPRVDASKAKVGCIRFDVTDFSISTDSYGKLKGMGRVENTSEEASSMTYIVVILKGADGNPIGQMFTILTDELKAGDKIGFEMSAFSLPDDVTMDSVADYEVFAYPMQMQF